MIARLRPRTANIRRDRRPKLQEPPPDRLVGCVNTSLGQQFLDIPNRAFEQLVGAKSFENAVEIQSQYAKKAYDTWVAEASKLGEMYAAVARDAYKPVEKAVTKRAS